MVDSTVFGLQYQMNRTLNEVQLTNDIRNVAECYGEGSNRTRWFGRTVVEGEGELAELENVFESMNYDLVNKTHVF